MAKKDPSAVRNLAVIGHGGAGKTSLCEAMLFNAKVTTRLNRVNEGNSVLDFTPEEIDRQSSISSSTAAFSWKGKEIYFVDSPGYTNFLADTKGVLSGVDAALVLVSAISGVKVETERVWGFADEYDLPRVVFVNKMDRERADFHKAVEDVENTLNTRAVVMQLPIGQEADFKGIVDLLSMEVFEYADGAGTATRLAEIPEDLVEDAKSFREKLVESAVETDDALMERYLEGGEVSQDELLSAIAGGTLNRDFVPVYCGAATANLGVDLLMDGLAAFLPSPAEAASRKPIRGVDPKTDEEVVREASPNAPFSGQVFKTIVDPFTGKLSLFRVWSGVLRSDTVVLNPRLGEKERLGSFLSLTGKDQKPVKEVGVGEIAAVAKLKNTQTGDTLCEDKAPIRFAPIAFPDPVISYAVEPKAKGDEDKLSNALQRMCEEEPTLKVERHEETLELIVSVMGMVQMEVILAILKRKFGVEVNLKEPKVPYKETIRSKVEVQGKYKKQSGGRGQYGDVWIRFEPLTKGSGFEFAEEVVGGVVPRQYIPAVEKGLVEAIRKGPMAGFPLVDLKATLYDGSYHTVDSSEMAFKIAASMALKKGCLEAKPVLLEPIMKMYVIVPDDFVGGVMSDLNSRRGKVLGVDARGKNQVISAHVPMSETLTYSATFRSITGGRGFFELEFDHYEELPAHLADKVVEAEKQAKEEAES